MKKETTVPRRHNFTNISDDDLEVGSKRLKKFGPLLYFRVLQTQELMRRTGYKHGIKSFHKFLVKLNTLGFIEKISEDKFSQQFVYPRERLIRRYDGNKWQKYALPDESLDTIKLYWQMAKAFQWLTSHKSSSEKNSYANNKGPYFDFRFVSGLRFGMYAYFPPEDDEAQYFKSLSSKISNAFLEMPILFTREWDVELFRELTKHYFAGKEVMDKLAWCHMDASRMTKEEILSAPLITTRVTTTLDEYVTSEAKNLVNRIENNEPEPEEKVSLWQSIKEVFN